MRRLWKGLEDKIKQNYTRPELVKALSLGPRILGCVVPIWIDGRAAQWKLVQAPYANVVLKAADPEYYVNV